MLDSEWEGVIRARWFLMLLALLGPARAEEEATSIEQALQAANKALGAAKHDEAWRHIQRALERDAQSLQAWDLRARWGEAKGDRGEFVYSLHKLLRLSIAQGEPKKRIAEQRARLKKADPIAADLLKLKARFLGKLLPLAKKYEKKRRPHSAINVHQEILALDPEHEESRAAIERISAAPDPSLAETAKAKDPFADVSEEWIRKHDARNGTWKQRAKLKGEHYTIHTDAGYKVLVLAAEAMEQMNAFYRRFFRHGTEKKPKTVPRIDVNIFKDRDEYLKLGIGPPIKWSGGHFTGGAVETYIAGGGFDGTTRTLFHEAAHQFVSLATNATGWLNEGLASFFEGCRIQANGTVLMNMPADHRLFSLANRLAKGWMADHMDGIDAADPSSSKPGKAPTWAIIIENEYEWGPAWYAPTWGVVYFLYNYQGSVDGRFVYRSALRTFIDKSSGRVGKGAVTNFEKVVLAHPQPPTPGVDFGAKERVALPNTVAELDEIWKRWILDLRDVQSGKRRVSRPYLDWAKHAITRESFADATEHFEKGLVATPFDIDLLTAFAEHLVAVNKNKDRASKLVLNAIQVIEAGDMPDRERIDALDQQLVKWDRSHRTLKRIRAQLAGAANAIVKRYADRGHDLMVMDLSARFFSELGVAGMLPHFEAAARRSKKSLALWRLAYNEKDLSGWVGASKIFIPAGPILLARFGTYVQGRFDYRSLTLDEITSGDFSIEAEVLTRRGENAFCGLVFGSKSSSAYHALVFFPGIGMTRRYDEGSPKGFLDLVSFFSPGVYKIWRH
ncbi:MAG: hypothetical protein O7C98_12875, partial [Planctomycetota bacterium]|nr:hypothetical protein [Planctomycetota bacterium]